MPKINKEAFFLLLIALINISPVIFCKEIFLDEYGTLWAQKDDIKELFFRTIFVHAQSPFYYLTAYAAKYFISDNLFFLRFISFLYLLGAAYYLYSLAKDLFDRHVAFYTLILFFSFSEIVIHAGEARPYALALFCMLAGFWYLREWLKTEKIRLLVLFSLFLSLMLYAHYIFALMLPVYLCYYLLFANFKKKQVLQQTVFCLLSLIVFLIPSFYQLSLLFGRRVSLSTTTAPIFNLLMRSIFFDDFLLLLIATVLPILYFYFSNKKQYLFLNYLKNKKKIVFLLCWLFLPITLNYIISVNFDVSLFLSRYYLGIFPAAALIGALVLQAINFINYRKIFIILYLVFFIWFRDYYLLGHQIYQWSRAPEIIKQLDSQAENPILLFAGYVENQTIDYYQNKEILSFINYPLDYFKLKNRIVPLPVFLKTDQAQEYFQKTILPLLSKQQNCFWILATSFHPDFKNIDPKAEPSWIELENKIKAGVFGKQEITEYDIFGVYLRRSCKL